MKKKNTSREEFIKEYEKNSIAVCRYALLFLMLVQIINVLYSSFYLLRYEPGMLLGRFHTLLHYVLLMMAAAGFAAFCLLKKQLVKYGGFLLLLEAGCVAVFFLWADLNTVEDLYDGRSIMIYCVSLLLVAAVVTIRPKAMALLLFLNHAVFIAMVHVLLGGFPDRPLENQINTALCVGGSLFIYYIRYSSAYRGYKNYRTVLEQNHSVLTMNNQLNELIVQLNQLVKTDYLSALYNKRYLNTILESEWLRASRQGQPLTVLMLDIDDFKKYNDTFGHTAGDECLVKVSEIIKTCVFDINSYCFRYGGEEFTVLLPGASEDKAMAAAESIRDEVEKLNISHQDEKPLTVSIGMYRGIPNEAVRPTEFISRADEALYLAKNRGKNQVCSYREKRTAIK